MFQKPLFFFSLSDETLARALSSLRGVRARGDGAETASLTDGIARNNKRVRDRDARVFISRDEETHRLSLSLTLSLCASI